MTPPSPPHDLPSPGSLPGAPPLDVGALLEEACRRIAPTWPLDRFIAVNPFWPLIDRPLPEVSAELTALSGSRLLMPRAWFRQQWREGQLGAEHLAEAIAQSGAATTVTRLEALLASEEPPVRRRERVLDVLDQQRDLSHQMPWRDFVVHSVSQFCAAYFDEGQAQFGPVREGGLYASWRRQALGDRSPWLLMGLGSYRELVARLPPTPRELATQALAQLAVPAAEHRTYLAGLLLDLNGWAAWCAYRRWTARLAGAEDDAIVDLLAIRLAWEWVLWAAGGPPGAARWHQAMSAWPAADAAARASQADDWLLQRALEISWQQQVCRQLLVGRPAAGAREPAAAQVVFCIDVRSEVLRRALEAGTPRVQTLGFAGFFGLPVDYQPLGSASARPQLPGLLAPRLRVTDTAAPAGLAGRRARRLDLAAVSRSFQTGALSSFTFVESLGLLSVGKLLVDAFGPGPRPPGAGGAGLSRPEEDRLRPRLTSLVTGEALGVEERSTLAAGMLRAMSLTRDFAPLVVLVGHGSGTVNNPHAAGLDCGACGGQTGEVNARAAAALLNEPAVRQGLATRGIDVPPGTRFVAGLHHTTTDAVTLFDLDELPPSHAAAVAELQGWFGAAGVRARRERAPRLGLADLTDPRLHEALEARSRDWAQIRPEWGLANNAAFIVAPRERYRHLDLQGRAFLHDYRSEDDPDLAILELIMTAPMVVTHWINLQYYASTVDNLRYGSGNKVLHNVVGGHLGVFEGNGGDLRIGLPLQSLHDGERWVHTPLRLSVFLAAPRPAIETILRRHDTVRALVDQEWLYLFQLDATGAAVHARRQGTWVPVTPGDQGSARQPPPSAW